jgi:DNA-binding protein HU-beta
MALKKAKATDKPLAKGKILEALAAETGLKKKDVGAVLEALTELAYGQAVVGFTFPGVGKLVVVSRKARKGRNPATGEAIKIPAKKVLKFRIAKAAKDAIVPSVKK